MNMKHVTAAHFRSAFSSAWRERVIRESKDFTGEYGLRDLYKSSSGWTRLMLGDTTTSQSEDPGVLTAALASLVTADAGRPRREWYTLDLVATQDEMLSSARDLGKGQYWSRSVVVAVEHENADDVETEMWKLVHWRCRLKVLVFYDFSDDDNRRKHQYAADRSIAPVKGSEWLDAKRRLLSDLARAVDERIGTDSAEFLLIVGKWSTQSGDPGRAEGVSWRYSERESRSRDFLPFKHFD